MDAAAAPKRFPYVLVSALGVGQLVAWGSFYYVFVSLTDPMAEEFGWTRRKSPARLSMALATTGLCSYLRGRWIDRYGGRLLMTCAAFSARPCCSCGLTSTVLWHLYAISVASASSQPCSLRRRVRRRPRMLGADYRKAIIVITLFGGLASTVFVPLTQFLITSLGWRNALICLAVIQLPFSAGIPYLLLRNRETSVSTAAPEDSTMDIHRATSARPVFWLLALSFVSYAFLFTSLIFNLVPMLHGRGYTTAEAVAAYACIGPSQLAGRVAILTMERFISLTVAGMIGAFFPVSQ